MMPSRPAVPAERGRRPVFRRRSGELAAGDFLLGVLDAVRTKLPVELRELEARHQYSLIKFYGEDPTIHYELWLHRSRGRVELGLHFETRDANRNLRLLEYVADDLLFLKETLGQGLEAEPWDKGWTRLYISYPLDRLGTDEQERLAVAFAAFIETLEPIRREASAASL
jgi:hypothetical protein